VDTEENKRRLRDAVRAGAGTGTGAGTGAGAGAGAGAGTGAGIGAAGAGAGAGLSPPGSPSGREGGGRDMTEEEELQMQSKIMNSDLYKLIMAENDKKVCVV
jgi:hypothetical protein